MKLIVKLVVFSGIVFLTIYFPFNFFSKKYVDPFYKKFTLNKSNNIIFGSSRAAQGLNPEALFNENGINFSFTHSISPYGKAYFDAIKKITKTEKGIVFLEVCPMIFMEDKKVMAKNLNYREENLILGNMFMYGLDPNLEYFLKNYEKPLYQIGNNKNNNISLNNKGWLTVKDTSAVSYINNLKHNEFYFNETFKRMSFCIYRYNWFCKTIEWLKKNNKTVFIIRLPISKELLKIENSVFGDFDVLIENSAKYFNIKYLNFTSDKNLRTHDGNHLNYRSATEISKKIKTEHLDK